MWTLTYLSSALKTPIQSIKIHLFRSLIRISLNLISYSSYRSRVSVGNGKTNVRNERKWVEHRSSWASNALAPIDVIYPKHLAILFVSCDTVPPILCNWCQWLMRKVFGNVGKPGKYVRRAHCERQQKQWTSTRCLSFLHNRSGFQTRTSAILAFYFKLLLLETVALEHEVELCKTQALIFVSNTLASPSFDAKRREHRSEHREDIKLCFYIIFLFTRSNMSRVCAAGMAVCLQIIVAFFYGWDVGKSTLAFQSPFRFALILMLFHVVANTIAIPSHCITCEVLNPFCRNHRNYEAWTDDSSFQLSAKNYFCSEKKKLPQKMRRYNIS